MSTLKFWDGSAWVAIGATPGPEGPQGPQGDPGPVWEPLNFQRIWCTAAGAYRTADLAPLAGGAIHTIEQTATLGAPFVQLSYTSAVPFWWEVYGMHQNIRKMDAAYHYCYAGLRLNAADQDGIQAVQRISTQHSTVDTFMGMGLRRTFRCGAGAWTVSLVIIGGNGGTWNYTKSTDTYLEAKAIAQ